eukprot:Protomagalhaensia_wolfi_Nauph_80__3644@NODE_367_length_2667_cov_16_683790_g277_i0_p2_GENE_NODE_367_length_2667_cov_16_683790_g277_i0NODE_367_length_2667_cov_16_683790_g277_i0_p2_ORF_typecomplete_len341_score37_84DUF3972/PF13118_6/0_02Prominin/PF05478_11/0_018Antiadapt_IraP/PF10796_9/0_13TetR_C_34/PF17929_1/0_22DivIVA/PF05103_13/0_89KAR9/PF08580_10/1_8_NODE_367_length_2667_cov_16_683790_g277_i016002622
MRRGTKREVEVGLKCGVKSFFFVWVMEGGSRRLATESHVSPLLSSTFYEDEFATNEGGLLCDDDISTGTARFYHHAKELSSLRLEQVKLLRQENEILRAEIISLNRLAMERNARVKSLQQSLELFAELIAAWLKTLSEEESQRIIGSLMAILVQTSSAAAESSGTSLVRKGLHQVSMQLSHRSKKGQTTGSPSFPEDSPQKVVPVRPKAASSQPRATTPPRQTSPPPRQTSPPPCQTSHPPPLPVPSVGRQDESPLDIRDKCLPPRRRVARRPKLGQQRSSLAAMERLSSQVSSSATVEPVVPPLRNQSTPSLTVPPLRLGSVGRGAWMSGSQTSGDTYL